MTQKLSTLFCILTVAATAANSLQKHPIICFTLLTYWKLLPGNIVDLSLTWQEAEERHEDHRQEAKGGDPGESLLAPHRAHLVWPNFIIYVFVYIQYTSTDVNKTLPCSLSWGTGRTHLKHHHDYVVWCSWFHVLMRQLTFNVVWGVSLKNLHADFASNGVTDQSELGGSWNQPLEQCNFVLYLGLQVVRGRCNMGTLVSINYDWSSWHGPGHNAGLNTFLTRKTEYQTPIVKIPFLFRIKWYW